ncbi:MAG: hypothetical protein M1115_11585 [Actinobacteria bacterium]|nr:hypothetical protein [Actinomycetota bacterium]
MVKKVSDVLTVPTSAVHTIGARSFVYVLESGKEVRHPVTLGATNGIYTEITSGLQPGEKVILAKVHAALPSTALKPGKVIKGLGGGGVGRAGFGGAKAGRLGKP